MGQSDPALVTGAPSQVNIPSSTGTTLVIGGGPGTKKQVTFGGAKKPAGKGDGEPSQSYISIRTGAGAVGGAASRQQAKPSTGLTIKALNNGIDSTAAAHNGHILNVTSGTGPG